jgi:hypothetical protein
MKRKKVLILITTLLVIGLVFTACGNEAANESKEKRAALEELTEEAKQCLECHATETPGIVAIWDTSILAEHAVSCLDCHTVDPDSPKALTDVEGHEDINVSVSMLVPPDVCAECHEDEVAHFHASGHERAYL